jgi:outer membrane protein
LSLSLSNGGYAVLQNSFANAGAIFELNLLPLRLNALVEASRAQVESSRASRSENERQTRFALASAYHQLQLSQALIPVWQEALKASSALLKDARAFRQAGLAARIDELRSRALQASDARGLAQAKASLAQDQTRLRVLLALPSSEPLLASDPIGQPAWPLDLATTEARALQERPLLEALRQQQQVQRQQARASRAQLLPSLTLLAGAGLSSDTLNTPVLSNSVGVSGTVTGSLPTLDTPSSASGQYYNWGAALLVRQPLLDGGQARAGARVAEREAAVLAADEEMARRQILQVVGETWSALQAAPTAIAASQAAVVANERALADARLRYRAMVEPLTETLLVQRDLQAARASLLTTLTRQAIDRAVLVRELGADPPR